ncbi:MAG: hypothetical protein CMF80_04200 [Candidatus Marinimicrobia bacterium]|nr:hypothetical protein [Candidatus Neomarinimicrobiota bacterium]
MNYYLSILLISISIPFIFSFHKKIEFYKKFNILPKVLMFSALPFIIWDFIFTEIGIWGFNKLYTSNFHIYNLPIEEILFFFFIPFCCLFTCHVMDKYEFTFFKDINFKYINYLLIFSLFMTLIFNDFRLYTFVCFLSCILVLSIENIFIKKIDYDLFYSLFLVIFIPFFFVNGALTGLFFDKTVVWYNVEAILGFRIVTIPIEDLFYSHQLILTNLIFFKKYDC